MGKLTTSQKKAAYDELLENINSNNSFYYAFASNPTPIIGNFEPIEDDDYSVYQEPGYTMLFGKKINGTNFSPVIEKKMWKSGEIYYSYDNRKSLNITSQQEDELIVGAFISEALSLGYQLSDIIFFLEQNYPPDDTYDPNYNFSSFYVISLPLVMGGDYKVFKCIDNNNNSVSTIDPGSVSIQPETIQTSDGYKWRYLTSISSSDFNKFSTSFYCPITSNASIQSTADSLSKIEKIVVSNNGSGYSAYHSGKLGGYINSTAFYLDSNASPINGFYTNNSIYIYDSANNYQLFKITDNYLSIDKRVVVVNSSANLSIIGSANVNYVISPTVTIDSDSPKTDIPTAYSVINTTSNSISKIVVLNTGSRISRADVTISSNFGSGANCYAVIPPPGGHGSNPPVELNMVGFCVNFSFSNSESQTIPTNVTYNKIGILKTPYYINSNNYQKSSTTYKETTFNQFLSGNTSYSFNVGDVVYGSNSGAKATVAWSNSSYVSLVGDYNFANNESLLASNGSVLSTIKIQKRPDIFSKSVAPIYINNINNVNRSNTQTETHKLIIKL